MLVTENSLMESDENEIPREKNFCPNKSRTRRPSLEVAHTTLAAFFLL